MEAGHFDRSAAGVVRRRCCLGGRASSLHGVCSVESCVDRAATRLQESGDGTEETLELKTQGLCQDESGPCGEAKELLGYRFELLFVYPYPQDGMTIEEGDYSVKIVVTAL